MEIFFVFEFIGFHLLNWFKRGLPAQFDFENNNNKICQSLQKIIPHLKVLLLGFESNGNNYIYEFSMINN